MPKEIQFSQNNSTYGMIRGVLRIIGKNIYYKNNNSPQTMQIISQLRQKGAKITSSEKWIQIEMFHDKTLVKLGNEEFDVSKITDEEIELKLYTFYMLQYKKVGYNVQGRELK